ncbi:DMT family transporter [Aeromonas caviae]
MIPPLVDRGPGRPALGQTLGQTLGALAAFAAGLLLALMIAPERRPCPAPPSPWLASWLAHGVGSLVAGLLWWLSPRPPTPEAAPPWAWLGGLPGALTVVLAALCLNSPSAWRAPWPCCCSASCCLVPCAMASAGSDWLAAAPRERRARRPAGAGRRPAYRAALGETP